MQGETIKFAVSVFIRMWCWTLNILARWVGELVNCVHHMLMRNINCTVDLELCVASENIQNSHVSNSFIRVHHTVGLTEETTIYLLMQEMSGLNNREEITSI